MPRYAIAILVLSLTSTVVGQSDDLRPLDQRVEDTSPLSRSLRTIERGLSVPTGFNQVYRFPGQEDLYMRINGGIHAVFPQSVYSSGRNGPVPLIPAGTIFYIGRPDLGSTSQADPSAPQDEGRVGEDRYGRLNLRLYPERTGQAEQRRISRSAVTVPFPSLDRRQPREGSAVVNHSNASTIVTDAHYRENRIRELMQSAANSVRARTLSTDPS